MALNTVSSDRLSTNVKNTNFTAAEKQDLTDDIKPLLGSSGGGNKNLIINGAYLIAQRNVDATGVSANGFATVDRFTADQSGTDEYIEQHQVDVSSGTTPYTLGFRKAFQVKNGNQSSGAGTSDRVTIAYKIEAQDMANSGWNYNSASSFVTFSYWVKSSVAQNFYNRFKSADSPSQAYVTETGSLSADTWTKITKTISGNSNIVFNNDNGEGLEITWELFRGTSQTGTRPLNAWAASDNNTRTPDQTSTWYTTNDATFEITGVQLEVGSVATDFEHRPFAEELELCKRYYQQSYPYGTYPSAVSANGSETVNIDDGAIQRTMIRLHKTMRANSATTVIYNPATGASNSIRSNSGSNFTPGGIYDVGNNSFFTDYTPNSGEFVQFHWTIEMEI